MVASSLQATGCGSSAIISDVDVCDEDSPEILYGYLSVPEGFYLVVNFSAVGFLVSKPEQNAVIAVASCLEKPPAE